MIASECNLLGILFYMYILLVLDEKSHQLKNFTLMSCILILVRVSHHSSLWIIYSSDCCPKMRINCRNSLTINYGSRNLDKIYGFTKLISMG